MLTAICGVNMPKYVYVYELFCAFLLLLGLSVDASPAASTARSSGFVITTSTSGSYSLAINDKTWLMNADTYFFVNGSKYSASSGSLKLVESSATSGTDKLGLWQNANFAYKAGDNMIMASIRTYQTLACVIFTQKYITAASGTSSGNNEAVSSAFPSFGIAGGPGDIGYLSYGGIMFGNTGIKTGMWTPEKAAVNSGLDSGPLVLFDHSNNTLVISAYSQFMASSLYQNGANVSWGVMGGVTNIPANYEISTIVYYGNKGINQAMADWGALLRFLYNRDQSFTENDLTNNYLGYWTDNGAYYYYLAETNKTYEQTIIDVKTYADKMNIPYRYVQYDSWWYFKGPDGGVQTWESMPDIFPHGMQYLYDQTGWPVSAHNRWWSSKTTYAKQNGGNYTFIIDGHTAIPQDPNFWTDLLREARKWGLITYEQDWLNVEFQNLNATLTTTNVGRDWLRQMGEGAAKNGLTIQYCMSPSRHALQTLEIPVVTQARVSDDYRPGGPNWMIGISSIFADAVGVRPFKDNFWTTTVQPGNKYHANETHTELEAVISTLSTGPVGPSDMIGGTNVSLLMRCCNADGLILKPSRPARNIDTNIMEKAFNDASGPDGEVWSTYSDIAGYMFGTILAPDQMNKAVVTPSDAGFTKNFPPSIIFKHTWPAPQPALNFSETSPLVFAGCSTASPCLWHTSPTWQHRSSTVFLYGELDKWVPMSPKRVRDVAQDQDILVTVVGAMDEVIHFSYGYDVTNIVTVTCNLGPSGSAIISYVSKSCTQL